MSKRLLKENVALKKIELSLKLQGKSFKAEFLNCQHCRFYWQNVPTGMPPRWSARNWDATTATYIENPNPKPPKSGWFCFNYKTAPSHAWLRFKVYRVDAEGKEGVIRNYYNPSTGSYESNPRNGEKDTIVLMKPGSRWQHCVCRRYESSPR